MEKNNKYERPIIVATVFCFLLYLICTIIINVKGMHLFFDTDMYEDLIISKYIWKQKTLFPNGWVFGNQYHIISTPVLTALLYGIIDDLYISLKIATSIMSIIIFASYVWMIKPFSSKLSICIGLLMLIASQIGCEIAMQLEGQLFFLGVSYYTSYLITLLITCGCYIRIINGKTCSKFAIIISLILCFCCGIQSLRETVILTMPLLLCSIFSNDKETLKYAVFVFISNLLGIVAIKCLNVNNNAIYGDSGLILNPSLWLDRLIYGFDSIKKISGLRWLFKGNPIGLFGLFLVFVIIVAVFISIKNCKKECGLAPLVLLLIISVFAVIGACVITNTNLRYIYLFPWFVLVSVSCAYLVDFRFNKVFYIILCSTLLFGSMFNLYISYSQEVKDSLSENKTIEKQVGDYINSSNYKYVYCEWVKLGKFMVNIEDKTIGGAWSGKPFNIIGYLNPLDIYSEEDNKEAVYLLYDYEIEQAIEIANNKNANFIKVAEFGNGEIQLYTSDIQLMTFEPQ